jgi:hypothetical protein
MKNDLGRLTRPEVVPVFKHSALGAVNRFGTYPAVSVEPDESVSCVQGFKGSVLLKRSFQQH